MNLSMEHLSMPFTIVPSKPMDDDALLEFCAVNEVYRIERMSSGALKIMSPAGSETGSTNAEISRQLANWSRADGRSLTFDSSAGFSLQDGSVLNPDASWMERTKWECLPADQRERFAPVCPTFVIELRSPSDSRKELERKMELWIANGAEVAWLIDPKERSVAIYRTGDGVETRFDPSTVQGSGPIAGFELVMSWVWGETP